MGTTEKTTDKTKEKEHARCTREAMALPAAELKPSVPLHVFFGEAIDAARSAGPVGSRPSTS